jgi:hypothetical protein
MKLNLPDLLCIDPEQICLAYSPDLSQRAELAAQSHSNATANRNAYFNTLCLEAFLKWVQDNWELQTAVMVLPSRDLLPSIWEVVNGTAVRVDRTQLVLIPTDTIDTEMFSVPQEWVDIPAWVANYYLPVRVDLENQRIYLWGYVTHRTLKTKGEYDPSDRTYSIERDALIPDLDIMLVAEAMGLNEKAQLQPLSDVNLSHKGSLLDSLSQPSPYSPRLEIEFERWGMLIAQDDWRSQLYQLRLKKSAKSDNLSPSLEKVAINVRLWLEGQIDKLAQDLSWILLPPLPPEGLRIQLRTKMRSPAEELESVINQLKAQGNKIPVSARGAYQDLKLGEHSLRLYAVTWRADTSESQSQWFLWLMLATQCGDRLITGTTMEIRDETQVLNQITVLDSTRDNYIHAAVSGNLDETFRVKLSLGRENSVNLPPFAFT